MKKILTLITLLYIGETTIAQEQQKIWHHGDMKSDGVPGVSLKEAYDYLGDRPNKKVIVAVIDSGFDTDHEALKNRLWVNRAEIAGNGKDDDGNGYVDDINGWNFIGGVDQNIVHETYELTREYRRLKPKYENVSSSKSKEFKYWKEIEERYLTESEESVGQANQFLERYAGMSYNYKLLAGYAQVDTLSVEALGTINSADSIVNVADEYFTRIIAYLGGKATEEEVLELFGGALEYYDYQANYAFNVDFDPRSRVGDDPVDFSNKSYGNNRIDDVSGYGGSHGTHVGGIVSSESSEMMIGIAQNVELMFVRAVPSGDERDKDVANAIYYAVDNGAQVINMSFGKDYSPNQEYVRKAVKYAEKNGVLMVHAAGNDGKNNDENPSFPDGTVSPGKKSTSWIEVGAHSSNYDENLPAGFSNYGKEKVDLFAPGVNILSTMPDDTYEPSQGTSMAAPVVTGVSALLMSYFPDLSAKDIKDILMQSTVKPDLKVVKPGSEDLVDFTELSKSGGLVNAFEAVKLADKRVKLTKN